LLIGITSISACKGSYLRKKLDETAQKKVEEKSPQKLPVTSNPSPANPPPQTVPEVKNTVVASPAPPPLESPMAHTSSDAQKIEEINGYVACLNRTMPRTNQSYQRYLSWVDAKGGPTCKESYISYGLYTLYDDGIEKCKKATQVENPSFPKMAKTVGELAAAYAELVPLAKMADDYYQQQDYKDDNCAKGKSLHPKLMDAFNRYRMAASKLQGDLNVEKTQLDKKELDRLEQTQGRKLAWYVRSYLLEARDLMNTVPQEKSMPFNPQSYLTTFDQLQKNYDALSNYVMANSGETQDVFWFSAFDSSSKQFYTKAKFLKRDLAEGKKADGEKLQDLVDQYNSFIGDANNLKFK
jgi:uncharacterized protein DUF3829